MTTIELKERTVPFAVRVLKLADALPKSASGRTVANQVARSGCAIAANYRAALWIEITERAGLLPPSRLSPLRIEAEELTEIFNATRTTARNHRS